jgi:hypothetical protein
MPCHDSSGSSTAQSCTTNPSFTIQKKDTIMYDTTTTNTGDLTIAVNGGAAVHVRKWLGSTVLASGDLPSGVAIPLYYDGTYWEIPTIGNSPSGIPNPSANGIVECTGTNCSTSSALTPYGSEVGVVTSNDLGTTANVVVVADGSHGQVLGTGTLSTGGSGTSVEVLTTTTVSGLSSITTTNGYAVAVGSTVAVTDAVGCGDSAIGGGSIYEELTASTVSGGAVTAWTLLSCGGKAAQTYPPALVTANIGATNSSTPATITGCSWPIQASKNYILTAEVWVTFVSSATIKFQLAGPGTATSYSLTFEGPIGGSAAYDQVNLLAQTAYATASGASGAPGAVTELIHVRAGIQNGTTASGTNLALQTIANGSNNINVLANSTCQLTQVN